MGWSLIVEDELTPALHTFDVVLVEHPENARKQVFLAYLKEAQKGQVFQNLKRVRSFIIIFV